MLGQIELHFFADGATRTPTIYTAPDELANVTCIPYGGFRYQVSACVLSGRYYAEVRGACVFS